MDLGTVGAYAGSALAVVVSAVNAYGSSRRRRKVRAVELVAPHVTREEHDALVARVAAVEAWYRREVLAYRASRPGE